MRKSPSYCVDIAGKIYGKWQALYRMENRYGTIYYMCRCACGIMGAVSKKALVGGKSLSCGCVKNYKSRTKRESAKYGKRWSVADILLLTQWYPRRGSKGLAKMLGRSERAINHKAFHMGLKCNLTPKQYNGRKNRWTQEELNILHKNYPLGGIVTCIKLLPNRTKNAIWVKAIKEGLSSPRMCKRKRKVKTNGIREQEAA
jgi:hypothetical protein